MRRLTLHVILLLFSCIPSALAQGILLPQEPPPVPLPHPLPGPRIPLGPHPLRVKSLTVDTRIQGQVATTRVNQVFVNDLGFVVDGTYFYPLPEDATFVDFATWDGDRKLRGEVLEKQEARNRYLAIVRKSWDPGLLEYAGANLFQARVFPVPARGEKRVEFAYSQILKADHGLVSYSFPLQNGTKINPQAIEKVLLTVDVQSDQEIKTIYSPSHTVDIRRDGERRARLSVESTNLLPDRSFQLFYSLANADFGLSLLTYRESAEDGYFMILLAPRAEQKQSAVIPKDILFVLDTSGSMQEKGKLDKALSALKFGVRSLNPGDKFNIITFSTETRKFRDGMIGASEEGKGAAAAFIDRQSAAGGTNIYEALKEALASFQSGERPRYLVFLTDGLPTVGETDPAKILRDMTAANPMKVRLFTFGVGYDVNTFLLDQLAARNYGAADYVSPDEDLELKLSNFFARVSSPVMTGLELDLGAVHAYDIYPRQLSDLFRGSQITVLGRYSGSGTYPLALRGRTQGEVRTIRYERNEFPEVGTSADFLPRLWAMRKVGYLLEQIRMSGENAELKNEIVRLAKKYGFVTPYTSYLAADEKDLVAGPVPVATRMPLQMSASADAASRGFSGGAVGGVVGGGGGGNAAPPPPSPKEAVSASVALRAMKSAEVAADSAAGGSKRVGSKTFTLKDNIWTDSAYGPDLKLPVITLEFGSDALLKAISSDPQLGSYAALGKNVVVVHNGRIYRIAPRP
jgi:Ca-activated chloride channel family protein